jgi:hypothetical protein
MWIPRIHGIIDRRILVNYRVDPSVFAGLLPEPFRPKIVHGCGMAGICLIRLKQIRLIGLPSWVGLATENAAHRIAVEWDEDGETHEGVYVRRRDTNSWFNSFVGGRLFPGYHHHANFAVNETRENYQIALHSDDGETNLMVHGRRSRSWPTSSIFDSLREASEFFQGGSVGYSATPDPSRHQGLELRCRNWIATPMEIEEVRSSYFDNESLFSKKSIQFDSALLMRDIEHEWHIMPDLCCPTLSASAGLIAPRDNRTYRGHPRPVASMPSI